MSPRARNRPLIVALAAGGVALAGALVAAVVPPLFRDAPQFVYNPSHVTLKAIELAQQEPWSVTRLTPTPDVELVGIVRTPRAADAPWLLVFGGNGADLLAGTKRLAEGIRAGRDWGVAIWAYRGFDASSGRPEREALEADALACVRELESRWSVRSDRLHLVGFSLGSYFAAHAGAALADAGTPPTSVALLAPFEAIDVNVNTWYRRWRSPDAYRTAPLAARLPGPTLVAHGEADTILPIAGAQRLADVMGARGEFVGFPGLGHVDLLDDAAVHGTVGAWLSGR